MCAASTAISKMSPIARVSFMTHPHVYRESSPPLCRLLPAYYPAADVQYLLNSGLSKRSPTFHFPLSCIVARRSAADKSLFNESDNPFLEAHPRWHRFPIYREGAFIPNESRVFESKTELLLAGFACNNNEGRGGEMKRERQ